MFTFIDLFAGIGGFHHALSGAGGQCVFVSEIDEQAKRIYEQNWGDHVTPREGRPLLEGDIIPLTDPEVQHIPDHDVLAAGFPCQPFSKSGFQRGINETRGTLFFNIAKILEAKRPRVIILENVRNLAGPRHRETWSTIIRTLRDLGYKVSDTPTVFSPHLLPPELGGTPQIRDRVFIVGTHVGRERAWAEADSTPTLERKPVDGWNPSMWDLDTHVLLDESEVPSTGPHRLSAEEIRWIDVWDDFVTTLLEVRDGTPLPGFPIWADEFRDVPAITSSTPKWKADFLRKNSEFYVEHRDAIDTWLARHGGLAGFPPSRRKLEWQAQDAPSLWATAMHFRPSGIRAKKPTYLPAMVAITQTSIIGPRRRRITVREGARLQGLPDTFSFEGQPQSASFKQLGNGVSAGVVGFILRESGALELLAEQTQAGAA
ncbi:DNA cytosine methyltransferase [Demequina rhizosphaerae]|uniref:DNA cytosine methyltransferase n=1 Tax=Demequina rhizosphaerae TaxID=1638985 RepID=UPI000781CFF0|nr:DNA cytosine methyltransferase [Demequina rhizosphaerae]